LKTLTDIIDVLLPGSETDLRKQAVQRELTHIRRTLSFKIKNKTRLTPAELHIAHHLTSLQNGFFAPTKVGVAAAVGRAFVRPSLVLGTFCASFFLTGNAILFEIPEAQIASAATLVSESDGTQKEMFLPKVALAMQRGIKVEPVDPELALSHFTLPDISTLAETKPPADIVPEVSEAAKLAVTVKDREEAQLRNQRSLVKFISGIIAAFRPSLKDSGSIARHIVELSATEGVDPIYVAAVIAVESRFSNTAKSSVGAMGLMQLMPTTAKAVAKSNAHRTSHLVDPRTNIQLGISYLKELESKFRGNRFLALSAYNWGPANIDKVRGRYRDIPASVRNYSTTVLERTLSWRRHFSNANESAEALQTVSKDAPASKS